MYKVYKTYKMNTNFNLGNMRAVQLKMQKDVYNSILHNQKMLAEALKHNVARQQAAPAPLPAPAPAPVPAPVPVRAPLPVPAPAPAPLQNHNDGHIKKLPKKGYNVLFKKK